MKRIFPAMFLCALAHALPVFQEQVFAQETAPIAVNDDRLYSPSAMPDRIILTWKENPATTQAVTWRTDSSVRTPVLELSLSTDGPQFSREAAKHNAETVTLKTDLAEVLYHSVNLTGLQPATLYAYRVGDGVNWSEWFQFRTAQDSAEPFTFIYFGDAQNEVKSHWSRVFREAYADLPRASFILHAGDLVNRGSRDMEWGEWHHAAGWVNATIPSVAIPGNHEYDIDRSQTLPTEPEELKKLPKSLTSHWQAQFEFPKNGPTDAAANVSETTYYIDYQGVRIIGLNSMEDFDVQAKWLRNVLQNNPNRWTIVTHHHPIYSVSADRDNSELRDAWQPVYDEFKVDLVMQGHDHSYGRTELRRYAPNAASGITARSGESGTMYVVSVAGPKMYKPNATSFVSRAENTQLYQLITVDGDQLHYVAKTPTGKVFDGFTLQKRQDGSGNDLLEKTENLSQTDK